MLVFPDVQILDATGPFEVFSSTNRWCDWRRPGEAPAYRIELLAADTVPVRATCGIELVPHVALRDVCGPLDTLIVAGGEGARAAVHDRALVAWIQAMAPQARRIASVCTGALLLAEAGLLAGKRATTHWGFCDQLATQYPDVTVEPDPIFVRDGNVYTSAGVTAGMDLALALVEEDCGREAALTVARGLVLFLQRPGGQAQFSAQLSAQFAVTEPVRDMQTWIADHLDADLSVAALAQRACMSSRHFARVFAEEVGMTPARYVERARVEAARRRLECAAEGIETVAASCGFGSAETMRRAFLRTLHVSPGAYRARFRSLSA